jgi:general secretion pathway protein G
MEMVEVLMTARPYPEASAARRHSIRARMPAPRGDALLCDLQAAWSRAFSLIEVLIVVALIGTIMAIALPLYMESIDKARVGRAQGDINAIGRDVQFFFFENGRYPVNLAEIGRDLLDPYGELYIYGVIEAKGGGGYKGRKDKFLVPVNSDFDVYSMGKDGNTTAAFTAKASHDDIVRANNGGFIGLAEDF